VQQQPTELRKFLWRYGSDVDDGFAGFEILVSLFLRTRVNLLQGKSLQESLAMARRFSADQAMLLKKELRQKTPFSLLPPTDSLDTLRWQLTNEKSNDPLLIERMAALNEHWKGRPKEVIAVVDQATNTNPEIGALALTHLASIVDAKTFWAATQEFPKVRGALTRMRPELLDSAGLDTVDDSEVCELIAASGPFTDYLSPRILSRLLMRADPKCVQIGYRFFADRLQHVILGRMDAAKGTKGPKQLHSQWLGVLATSTDRTLRALREVAIQRTSTLAEVAAILNHDSGPVLEGGPDPWATALGMTTVDDSIEPDRQLFLVFLIAISLVKAVPSSCALAKFAFDEVHFDLSSQRMSWPANLMLQRHLPSLGWWNDWDKCMRLRAAIVNLFKWAGLGLDELLQVTSHSYIQAELTRLWNDKHWV